MANEPKTLNTTDVVNGFIVCTENECLMFLKLNVSYDDLNLFNHNFGEFNEKQNNMFHQSIVITEERFQSQ